MKDRFRWEAGEFTVTLPRKAAQSGEMKYSEDQPRGDDGRWSSTGGGGDVVGSVRAGAQQGGFTVHPFRGTSPKTGFQVALPGHSETLSPETLKDPALLKAAIDAHIMRNANVYKAGGRMYLGGWVDPGGSLVFEPSEHVSGSRAEAVALGQGRDQVSIWDNANSAEIQTGGSGAGSVT